MGRPRGLFDCPSRPSVGNWRSCGRWVLWRYPSMREKQQVCLSSLALVLLGWPAQICPPPYFSKHVVDPKQNPPILINNILCTQQSFPTHPLPPFFALPSTTFLLLPLPTPQHLQMPRLLRQRPLRLPRQTSRIFLLIPQIVSSSPSLSSAFLSLTHTHTLSLSHIPHIPHIHTHRERERERE